MYETGMHPQISEHSRRYYSGGKHEEFQDDVMTIVHDRYGSQDTPTTWIVKDITSDLKAHGVFWKRWNAVDHLFTTHADLSQYYRERERERERESE
jgi:hypothetical protein